MIGYYDIFARNNEAENNVTILQSYTMYSDFISQFNSYGFSDSASILALLKKDILPDLLHDLSCTTASSSSG